MTGGAAVAMAALAVATAGCPEPVLAGFPLRLVDARVDRVTRLDPLPIRELHQPRSVVDVPAEVVPSNRETRTLLLRQVQ